MDKQEIDVLLKESEEFIQSVIQKKYCHSGEKTWSDIVNRYKKGLEEDKSIWEGYNLQKVPRLMAGKKLIPAGSNLYGYKNKEEKVSLSNCYFLAIEQDSMDGIYEFMKQQAKTYSWRGGVGTDISILRPRGAKVNNAAKTSSGAVSFMPLLSENTNTIGQNGRRGAHIITIEDWHPDLPLFIKCKTNPKEVFDYDFINDYTPNVYYANISVKLSDKFFEAVKNDEEWELVYPDIEADKDFYNKHWDGNIKNWFAKGGKIKTYAKVKAKDILNSIAEGMWQGAEPGVLYWDTVLKETQGNLLGTEYEPKGVNPCVTGDTLIIVADGRGEVSIKQLAEEGKDVPVFGVDENGNIVVKMMRHPRVTGYNEDIYEVKFDDGSIVKVTGNHKFRLKDGSYKETKTLKEGDEIAYYKQQNNIWSNGKQTFKLNNKTIDYKLTDLKTFTLNDKLYVIKHCEVCGSEFYVPFNQREQAYCSENCLKRAESKQTKLIENELSYKVVSVKYIGKDTVYNGTVDDIHNFMIKLNQVDENTIVCVNTENCGEQILSQGGNCNLIGVVLYQFVKNPFTKNATLDFNSLAETLKVALEFGDYTIDINKHPIPIQNEVDKQLRKVGIEFTGLADMLAMLGYEYDNPETIDFVDKLFANISSILLIHNVEMAKMKGCCPVMKTTDQRQKFLKIPVVQRILKYIQLTQSAEQAKQIYDDILQYGVRNIAWLNNGPTGSISIIANNCTSGIEPLFKIAYVRRSRLLGKETNVLHLPLMKWLIENKPEDLNLPEAELKKKYHYKEAHEIDFHYRVKLQGTIQKWVTDSISSTINLPENITPKEIADLILEGWSNGLKGLTIFRDNSIKGVLSTKSDNENKTEQILTKLPIPPERQSFTYTMYWKKVKVYVTIPVVDNYPVEVFAKLPWEAYLDAKGNKSIQLKLEREANWNALSRMVSLALRYKLPMEEITKALDKSTEVLNDLPNIISRALKKTMAKIQVNEKKQQEYEICPECGKKQVIKEGGCKKCLACGWSKCE